MSMRIDYEGTARLRLHWNELAILLAATDIGHDIYLNTRGLAQEAGVDEHDAARIIRGFCALGLLEHVKGLMNDDGLVAGSGYRRTERGRAVASDACAALARAKAPEAPKSVSRYRPGSKALSPGGCDDCGLNWCHCIESGARPEGGR